MLMKIQSSLLFFLLIHLSCAQSPKLICKNHFLNDKFKSSSKKQHNFKASLSKKSLATLDGAQNILTNEGFTSTLMLLKFQQLVGDTFVNIWVDKSKYESSIVNNLNSRDNFSSQQERLFDRDQTIQEIGRVMVEKVVPGIQSSFGVIQKVNNSFSDGINVYVYDIKDQFDLTGGFIGGYFDPNDKFGFSGNRSNAIHMDMYPLNPGGRTSGLTKRKEFFQVLAHEMQHLVHSQFDDNETIWLNEGFSQFAIYRLLHQAKFSNGEYILNSPFEAPSQVGFWLSNPKSSLLMTFDEPNFLHGSSDTAELRGIGYLFFCYLWELVGGKFNTLNEVTNFDADLIIKNMIKNTLNGRASIDAILKTKGMSFDEAFAGFFMALFHDGKLGQDSLKFINMQNFVNQLSSGLLKVNGSLNTQGVLDNYDYFAIPFSGVDDKNSILGVNFSPSIYADVFGESLGHAFGISDLQLHEKIDISVPQNSTRILLGVNTLSTKVNYLITYDSNVQLTGTALPEETIVENDLLNGITLNISMLSNEIVRKRINNNSSKSLSVINENQDIMKITACVAGVNCLNASKLKISKLRASRLKVNKSVSNAEANLAPNTSYDLYFSNQTNLNLSLSPKIVNNSLGSVTLPASSLGEAEEFGSNVSGCFLASASFLGKDSYEVKILSYFRDNYLLNNYYGQKFVSLYYTYSPFIAEKIEKNKLISLIGQFLLIPLLFVVSLLGSNLMMILLLMSISTLLMTKKRLNLDNL
ncbi:MAG: hypothetical protein COB02_08015 [Candidatus Cloacimonadota bacterium]|nr:MAG: hypothetical protein COB02_08015 [Candidatus Cloacimonadota bacterium]